MIDADTSGGRAASISERAQAWPTAASCGWAFPKDAQPYYVRIVRIAGLALDVH